MKGTFTKDISLQLELKATRVVIKCQQEINQVCLLVGIKPSLPIYVEVMTCAIKVTTY